MKNELLLRLRRLTLALILSGCVNILLVSFTCYWFIRERPPTPYCERKPIEKERRKAIITDRSNSEIVALLKKLSYQQLLSQLKNQTLVENGFSYRDLALGCLITFHHFDVNHAVMGLPQPSQKRAIQFREKDKVEEVITYSHLTDDHYKAIMHFAQTEKWPFTSEGLFHKLKSPQQAEDKSLAYAFCLTPEFLAVELLFKRSPTPVKRDELLEIILEGPWSLLNGFVEKQRFTQDLSEDQRRQFLISYIHSGARAAAELLLKTDFNYATKKLDDNNVLQILKLATNRTADAARFALIILTSPRSDDVWKEAANRLYEFSDGKKPDHYDRNMTLSRFVPLATAPAPQNTVATQPPYTIKEVVPIKAVAPVQQQKTSSPPQKRWRRAYTIQEGDTLWKLGKRFHVDVDSIKRENNLKTDALQPGALLYLP